VVVQSRADATHTHVHRHRAGLKVPVPAPGPRRLERRIALDLALGSHRPPRVVLHPAGARDHQAARVIARRHEAPLPVVAPREGPEIAALPRYFVREDLARGALVEPMPDRTLARDRFWPIWAGDPPLRGEIAAVALELRVIPVT